MRAAVKGRGSAATQVLAVTVLTSLNDGDLAEIPRGTPGEVHRPRRQP